MLYRCMSLYSDLKLGAEVLDHGAFASGSGPIYLSNLKCDGTESSLLECLRQDNQPTGLHSCEHHNDVAVRCRGNMNVMYFGMHWSLHGI